MSVTKPQIQKLATLSRLSFSDEKIENFSNEFNNILKFVDKIQEVNTEGVAPLTAIGGQPSTPERPDVVTETNNRDAHQKNAPKAEAGFFVVPQIVE